MSGKTGNARSEEAKDERVERRGPEQTGFAD